MAAGLHKCLQTLLTTIESGPKTESSDIGLKSIPSHSSSFITNYCLKIISFIRLTCVKLQGIPMMKAVLIANAADCTIQ
jgi:hypothetical protein